MQQAGLDLIAYLDDALGHHCPICFFLEFDNSECPHKQQSGQDAAKQPQTRVSNLPSYASSLTDGASLTNSTDTVTAKVSDVSSNDTLRSLRRKSSPTGTTLRDLRTEHSQQPELRAKTSQCSLLRRQQSDDRLRQVYEEQMLSYLESPLAEFHPFRN